MATNYSPIDIYQKKVTPLNATLDIIEQDATYYPENTDSAADLKEVAEENWHKLANVNTVSFRQETEDDPVEYFDADTHTRVEDKNTIIKNRYMDFNVVNHPLLFNAVYLGIPNPTSAEAQDSMSAGSDTGFQLFASTDPKIPVGLRVRIYDNKTRLLQTLYFYGQLLATGDMELNGKISQPTIQFEVKQSTWNRGYNTAAFTGQTETT